MTNQTLPAWIRAVAIVAVVTVATITAAAVAGGPQDEASSPPRPRSSDLVERAERRLVQLDVTVDGDADAIADLGPGDFEVVIDNRFIESFVVDPVCDLSAAEAGGPAEPDASAAAASARPPDGSVDAAPVPPPVGGPAYLLYFDQHNLTGAGRQNAIDEADELVDRLVVDGARAMIVSAGQTLATVAELTSDRQVLHEALRTLENDRTQWDPYPYAEDERSAEVVRILNKDGMERAVRRARQLAQEEVWHTDKALRLFAMVVGRLADLDPPKVALYFADTMRKNPGEHYLGFFGGGLMEQDAQAHNLSAMRMESFAAANPFDRLVEAAGAHGVRIYTVQAEGLTTPSSLLSAPTRGGSSPTLNQQRVRDAQDSLSGLALETGGRAFLNGIPAPKIAARIRQDLSCLYLISFDAAGFPLDSPLSVRVRVKRPGVKAFVRGQIVVQSDSRKTTDRLLAAFAGQSAGADSGEPLRGVVVPTGFADGRYTALVQVAIPPSPFPGVTWQVGLSTVAGTRITDDDSMSLTVQQPGVPLVVEREVDFRPGPYEIIFVAMDDRTGRVHSGRVEGEWQAPSEESVILGPFAAMQPADAAFVRDGRVSASGALGSGAEQTVRVDRPTAVVGLVCRGSSRTRSLTVERALVGTTSVPFQPLDVELQDDRCVQVRDVIPAGTMSSGAFSYDVRASFGGHELGTGSFPFFAIDAEPQPSATQ